MKATRTSINTFELLKKFLRKKCPNHVEIFRAMLACAGWTDRKEKRCHLNRVFRSYRLAGVPAWSTTKSQVRKYKPVPDTAGANQTDV